MKRSPSLRAVGEAIAIGIGPGLLYWIVDSAIDAYLLGERTLIGQLLQPTPHELWTRSFVAATILALAFVFVLHRQAVWTGRESEQWYGRIVNAAQEGIWMLDAQANTTYVNQPMADMLGYSVSEMLGRPLFDFMDEEAPLEVQQGFGQQVPGGVRRHDCRYRRQDGSDLWTITSVTPMFDDKGRFIGALGMIVDIAERKRAEEALRIAMAKSEAIVAAIGDSISIQDTNFKVRYQNQIHKDTVGDHAGEYCYQAYERKDHVCEGCPVAMSFEDGKIHTTERVGIALNGRVAVVEIMASPLRDSTGQIVAGIEVARDVTKRKRVEEELRLFSQAVEAAPDGVQVVDLDGHIIYSNKAVEEIYGFTPEWYKGRHVSEMNVDPEFADKVIIPSIRQTGRWAGEVLVKHKDGRAFLIWLTASMIKGSNDEPMAMVGVIRDITERKQMEETLRTLSFRDELTGLHNRRGFMTLAEQQLKIANRMKQEMSLLLVDLDDLKTINDTLGHLAGDAALIEFAAVLKETFRDSDVIARIGGDEFAVMAVGSSEEGAKRLSARLQEAMEASNSRGQPPYRLSASMGIASYHPEHPGSLDELMAQADILMYEQKRAKQGP